MDTILDKRHIRCGWEIPSVNYSDQPYVVIADDGAWVCTMTTAPGDEGDRGQHVVCMRSTDQGRTWSDPVRLEPADGRENSYSVLLKTPSGRIYCFYNHNTDNLREVIADDPPYAGGINRRMDCVGYYVFRYSDDHGRTWSPKRYNVPVRLFEIDRENPYGGEIRFFWNVGRPFIYDGAAYLSLHKVGRYGYGGFARSEGVLIKSDNILTEPDPDKIRFETLPEGEIGLRAPAGGGPVAEEQSYTVLSDGSFFVVYRTIDGHPAFAYSRDRGRTWSAPRYLRYDDGRLVKHPRAANFIWRLQNGKYLYWYHNHGGRGYEDRNPVWLCGGIEGDSPDGRIIRLSQPEIVLYDDDPFIRMSYPDLIEDGGKVYLSETQKDIARIHEIDPTLLEGLWNQFDAKEVATEGLLLELPGRAESSGSESPVSESPRSESPSSADSHGGAGKGAPSGAAGMPKEVPAPSLPRFVAPDYTYVDHRGKDLRAGFSVDFWLRLNDLAEGQVIADNRTESGQGFCIRTTAKASVEIIINDGRTENRWEADPYVLTAGERHHVTVIVDGGPKIIMFVVDGKLCDGGTYRQFGWGRFSPHFRSANGSPTLRLAPNLRGELEVFRVYGRALRVSEACGNFRSQR